MQIMEKIIIHQEMEMFESIASLGGVFYKSQQRDEPELDKSQKISILDELYQQKPHIFLERYHQLIEPEFISLFNKNDPEERFYLDQIAKKKLTIKPNQLIRNRRYLAMQGLKAGYYFTNEKMREREPYLFDIMVGRYLNNSEKLQLRPTVEITDTNRSEFSKLLEQLDNSQRVSDKRKCFLENYRDILSKPDYTDRFINHVEHRTIEADDEEAEMEHEFEMEFDSSDEEGQKTADKISAERKARHCAKRDETFVMRRQRDRIVLKSSISEAEKTEEAVSLMRISKRQKEEAANKETEDDEWSSGDEKETMPTGLSQDKLHEEFISMMEERFIEGRDAEFFDYSKVDAGIGESNKEFDKIKEQDMEDAYFDYEEPE